MFTMRFDMRAAANGATAADFAGARSHRDATAAGLQSRPLGRGDVRSRHDSAWLGAFRRGSGYRPEEYGMMGVDFAERGRIMDQNLHVLLRAKTGEPFDHDGQRFQVTPAPFTPGGPSPALGGQSPPAARRAERNGLDLLAQTDDPRLRQIYLDACREAVRKPGRITLPPSDAPSQIFVADDVDAAWGELGPFMMNDVLPYAV